MDAAREVAQLLQRELRLLPGLPHQLSRGRIAARGALLGHPQIQRQRHEALLGAVVEVALDPPALRVRGRDDARAGVLELVHLRGEHRVGVRAEQLRREPSVEPAKRAQGGNPDEQHERAEGHRRDRLPERVDPERPELHIARNAPSSRPARAGRPARWRAP